MILAVKKLQLQEIVTEIEVRELSLRIYNAMKSQKLNMTDLEVLAIYCK